MPLKWTVFWSRSLIDKRDEGEFEVEAHGFARAYEIAVAQLHGEQDYIKGIIRSDLLQELKVI